MRIMVAGVHWTGLMLEYVHKALVNSGHEAKIFYFNKESSPSETFLRDRVLPYLPLRRAAEQWRLALNRRFLKEASDFSPELIVVFKGDNIYPETIKAIGERSGARIFNWCGDDPFRYPLLIKSAPFYDRIFLTDSVHLQQLGFLAKHPVVLLPNAADPETYKPVELSEVQSKEYGCDISVVATADVFGSAGIFRASILKALGAGFDLRIYGDDGWGTIIGGDPFLRRAFTKKMLTSEETNIVYNASKIVLNINHPQNNKSGVGQRTFEIPCAGAFQLMDKRGDTERFFKPGEEIICYDNLTELKDMIGRYLGDPALRKEIGSRARNRVLEAHTYGHRVQTLLGYC